MAAKKVSFSYYRKFLNSCVVKFSFNFAKHDKNLGNILAILHKINITL